MVTNNFYYFVYFFYPPNKRWSNGPISTQVCCPPSSQGNFSSKIHCVRCVICLLFDPDQVACTQFLVKSAVCSCCYKFESSKNKPKLYHKTPQTDSPFKDARPLMHSFFKNIAALNRKILITLEHLLNRWYATVMMSLAFPCRGLHEHFWFSIITNSPLPAGSSLFNI